MQTLLRGLTTWKDMRRNALDGTEWANKTIEQLYEVSTPCLDDHQLKNEELETVEKCLHLARIGRLDILWSVNQLARAVTQWRRACDRRLARLISYIHNTRDPTQYCHVGNTAQHCGLGLFHRNLSEPWAGFTQFTILNDKPPDGYMWSRECEHYTTPAHIPHFGTREFSRLAQVHVVCVLLKRSSSFLVCHVSFMHTVT